MLYRLAYFVYRKFSSMVYWMKRRFTVTGLAILAGLLVSALGGFDTEKSLTHQAFCLLFVLLMLSWLGSVGFRGRFSAERILPRFGTAGTPLPYQVVLRNETRKNQTGLTLLEDLADPRPSFEEFVAQMRAEERRTKSFRIHKRPVRPKRTPATVKEREIPSLPPGGQVEVALEMLPQRRGVIRFAGVSIGRPDPLGCFKSLRTFPLPDTVLILPKRYYLPPLALPGTMKYQQGGVALASSVGESEEFIALRDYRPGDPLRHIHWRSWAKRGAPVVKEFEDEFYVRHALILDTFLDQPDSQVFEEAVSLAASFACTIQTQESLLDLLFVGPQAYCFTAGRGLAHTEQMLEILAAVRVCRDQPFDALKCLVLNHVKLVSGCIVILLAWDEPRRQLVEQLQVIGVPMRVFVIAEEDGRKALNASLREVSVNFQVLEAGNMQEDLAKL